MATKSFLLRLLAVVAAYGAVAASPICAQTAPSDAAGGRFYGWLFRPATTNPNDYYLASGGEWTTANNWSLGASPNGAENAVFSQPPTPTNNGVYVNGNVNCYNLTINSTNSVLLSPAGSLTSLTIGGISIVNQNTGSGPAGAGIQIYSTGGATDLIIANSNVTLSGGGTVFLDDPSNARIYGTSASNVLTNADNTIEGTGNIGYGSMGLVNQGTINATGGATHPLTIQTSNGTTNTGTLEASGNSNLILDGDTYTNTGGTLLASGAGAAVIIQGATINGGTLNGTNGGFVQDEAGHNATLNGVTNIGTFDVVNQSSTTIVGTITNSGTIQLTSTGSNPELILGGFSVTLTGGGTVTLNNSGGNWIFGASASDVLTNVNNTIQGSGNIGMDKMGLVNQGTVDANQSTPLYIQTSNGTTNTGTLEATNGANLILDGDTYANTSGKLFASGTGSVVSIYGATIDGGTLNTASGGAIQASNGSVLSGVTNSGTLQLLNESNTTMEGTITNNGAIQFNSTGSFVNFDINGNTTLSGTGTVVLNNSSGNTFQGAAGTDTLTNGGNTIEGSGNIGNGKMTFVNNATVNANQSTPLYIQTSNGTTNTGTLEATAGANLILDGDTYTNTGGTLYASGSGSQVTIQGATIDGGNLNSASGGVIAASGATLNGVTNAGTLQLDSQSTNTLENTIANSGTILFDNKGGYVNLVLGSSNVTLNGGGTVTLNNFSGNSIYGAAATDVLTNADNTIQGSGNIGKDLMGLVNQGTVDANQSTPLYIQTSNGASNTGTLEASNGGTLVLDGDTYTNRGGTIQATGTGSVVDVQGATVNGGTLTTASGGLIQVYGNAILSNVTNTGSIQVPNENSAELKGTIANKGTITLDNAGSYVDLYIDGDAKLTGTGSIVMNNNSGNTIEGVAGTEVLTSSNTIEGSGDIGNAKLGLVNNGTVLANQSTVLYVNTNSSGFVNNGTVQVNAGSRLEITGGPFSNFNGSTGTLTGGTYNVDGGTLQFGASGSSLTTNAASITLSGSGAALLNPGGHNLLSGFTTNAATGSFALASGASLTTAGGSLTNAGTFNIGTGSTFTVGGGTFNYTQTGGATTVNGTLTSSSLGTVAVDGGSLDGVGMLGDNVVDSSTLAPGDSKAKTGTLTVADTYTQESAGTLDIQINGSKSTKYDQLQVTQSATLGGTLDIGLKSGFIPKVGAIFTILTASSVTGTFATVDGLAIDGSEHFTITYNAGSVVLTVVSGALSFTQLIHAPLTHNTAGKGLLPPVSLVHPAMGMHGFRPLDDFGSPVGVSAPADTGVAGPLGMSPVSAAAYNSMAAMNHMRFECGVDLKALLKTSRKQLLKGLWASPDSPDALAIGYMTYNGSH
jgi:hypothetical protein